MIIRAFFLDIVQLLHMVLKSTLHNATGYVLKLPLSLGMHVCFYNPQNDD